MAHPGVLFAITLLYLSVAQCKKDSPSLLLMTVATEPTDGFKRYVRSTEKHGLDLEVLGMGQKWEGGDVATNPGGGQKILLLRTALEKHKDKNDLLIMFTDSYDLILTDGPEEIVKRFKKFSAKTVFSAEGFCWPDELLADKYPQVKLSEKRFLNSGGFIGYAPELYAIVTNEEVREQDDDQLYYTRMFLDKDLRNKFSMKLDVRSEIFQNLNGALDEVELKFKGNRSYLYNSHTGNTPIVVHGNGPIKHKLNTLANYLNDNWTPTTGCQNCDEDSISLEGEKLEDFPSVYLAIFFEHLTPFAPQFLEKVGALNYPKDKMTLFIHYAVQNHEEDIRTFMDNFGIQYNRAEVHGPTNNMSDGEAKNRALEGCVQANSQYFLYLEGESQLENPEVLTQMIERNRSVIAPFLMRPGKMWSNFWGSLNLDGFYERSEDYLDIIQDSKKGVWNVPYITAAYLVHGYLVPKLLGGYTVNRVDTDMAICKTMRDVGIFMYVDNMLYNGHLVDSDEYETMHVNSDLYDMFNNKYTWEQKYLHPSYRTVLDAAELPDQPCTDVFWLPLFSEAFCRELIEVAEQNGGWSGGQHDDPRISGGYENVPTDDIHMNQLDWEKQWLQILEDYVGPVANKVFAGYYTEARAIMNFMVRYNPAVQDRLKPHADSSTYTLNLALNRPRIDYQGGGVRFLRYNCTVTDLRLGWGLLHPGRLTHHHEGLPTTGGTRYIMISFIDP